MWLGLRCGWRWEPQLAGGAGGASGGLAGAGQSAAAKWSPRGPIFEVICKAELLLCLCPRTPHFQPQPGKVCAVGATVASASSKAERAAVLLEPLRNEPVWPVTNLTPDLASAWVVSPEDTKMYLIRVSPTQPVPVPGGPPLGRDTGTETRRERAGSLGAGGYHSFTAFFFFLMNLFIYS